MRKKVIILCILFLLTGCTVTKVDTTSINKILDVILPNNYNLYNRIGIGYKYYLPRGITYIDSDDTNDLLYSNGNYYYLYLDEIGYYYNLKTKYKVDSTKYYSKKITYKNKSGYLDITKEKNLYLITFVYNHAKMETKVPKAEIKNAITYSSYVLSTIKYNKKIIKLSLGDDFLKREEKYDEFSSKKHSNNFLKVEKE